MKQTFLHILVGCAVLTGGAATVSAQSGGGFNISLATIDGGGPSAGGDFSLNGTIGQPDAGAMTGGAFMVSGGFWAGVSEARPRLAIRLAGANTVILTWPNPSTGYVLEQAANLSDPSGGWTDVTQSPVIVGPNKEVTLQATGQTRLFRLRKL